MTATARNLSREGQTRELERCQQWLEITPLFDQCSLHLRGLLRLAAESQQLSERHAMILWHASTNALGVAQIELARHLALSPAQLSLLLEQLRERGLLQCVRDPHDRRRQRNQLTTSGQAAWSEIRTKLAKQLADSQQTPAIETLDRLRVLLESLCQTPLNQPALKVLRTTSASESNCQEGK